MGDKRVYWLTVIEEEHGARTSSPPTRPPLGALQRSAMSASFAGNGSPRVFGEARRVGEARSLCDQAHGTGASSRSYTGRGRRFPEMEP